MRGRVLHLLGLLSSKGNEVLEQFVIGYNEGKREEIMKFVLQQKELHAASGAASASTGAIDLPFSVNSASDAMASGGAIASGSGPASVVLPPADVHRLARGAVAVDASVTVPNS
jgi:hypothetical protein